MKNKMKRLFSLVLVAMLLVCVLPLNAMAAPKEAYLVADVTYTGNPELSNCQVRLHVFKNLNMNPNSCDDYNLTTTAKNADKLTYAMVDSFLRTKYTAADTSKNMTIDGLYDVSGNWAGSFVYSTKTSEISNINYKLNTNGNIDINVMINNAKAKGSSTADSSNPKTGDTIFVPVMVMGVTATALAAAYVFGKKRIAR